MSDEEVYLGVSLAEPRGQFLDDRHGTVPAPGAADAQSKVRLPLRGVAGDKEGEHAVSHLEEPLRVVVAEHGFAHRFVVPGEGAQYGIVVRVREKPGVEEGIHIQGGTVLEAEGDQADREPAREGFGELLEPEAGVQRGVARGVDYEVCLLPQVRQVLALRPDGLKNVAGSRRRVRPAALLITADQRPIVGLDEEDAPLPPALLLDDLEATLELLPEVPAAPDVHDHYHSVGAPVPP